MKIIKLEWILLGLWNLVLKQFPHKNCNSGFICNKSVSVFNMNKGCALWKVTEIDFNIFNLNHEIICCLLPEKSENIH